MIPEQIFDWLMIDEGGLTNDPDDDEGITKFGVTQTDLMKFYGRASPQMIIDLTKSDANRIFERKYWAPLRCGEMPPAIGYVVFDAGILHGITRSAIWLQTELGVKADGQVGPVTLTAARACDQVAVIEGIFKWRMQRIKQHADYKKFGRGWMNRFTRVKTRALKLIQEPSRP